MCFREVEGVVHEIDEDVEEGARDLMELNEDISSLVRKRARSEARHSSNGGCVHKGCGVKGGVKSVYKDHVLPRQKILASLILVISLTVYATSDE